MLHLHPHHDINLIKNFVSLPVQGSLNHNFLARVLNQLQIFLLLFWRVVNKAFIPVLGDDYSNSVPLNSTNHRLLLQVLILKEEEGEVVTGCLGGEPRVPMPHIHVIAYFSQVVLVTHGAREGLNIDTGS